MEGLQQLWMDTQECFHLKYHEAASNMEVHGPLLKTALSHAKINFKTAITEQGFTVESIYI